MKKLVFALGKEEVFSSRDYASVFDVFRRAGFDPEAVELDWGDEQRIRTINDQTAEFRLAAHAIEMRDSPEEMYYGGFSLGAMVGLNAAAAHRKPAGVIACALSPFYREDMVVPRRYHRNLLPERREAFERLSFIALAQHITCPVELFVGSEDFESSIARADDAAERLPDATLTEVPGAGHVIEHPAFLEAMARRLPILSGQQSAA
ncbi:MAG: hypothetical protein ABWX94_03290 [Candidatus Saccharimonadales bacterium]